MSAEQYKKASAYSLEKSRLSLSMALFETAVILLILLSASIAKASGFLADILAPLSQNTILLQSLFVIAFSFLYSLFFSPAALYRTFSIEARYGFNTTTLSLFIKDMLKNTLLSLLLSFLLLSLIFLFIQWFPQLWWILASMLIIIFQLTMQVIFVPLILPLFNKLKPLDAGPLKERLLHLNKKVNFGAKNVLVIDSSKRSRHSNAFFTGFGKAKKIVLYDTLIESLSVDELEAVLAHEMGHYKKKHVLKNFFFSAGLSVLIFFIIQQLLANPAWQKSFLLSQNSYLIAAEVMILLSLVASSLGFWIKPLFSSLSKKHEYEADFFAYQQCKGAAPLISALETLHRENLANLRPSRWYRFFHHSHPSLDERKAALLSY